MSHLTRYLSDHAPVVCVFQRGRPSRALYSWIFPSEVLQDLVGKDTLTQLLTDYMEHDLQSTHSRATEWEACKTVLRGGCMGFTCRVRKTLQAELTEREDVLAAFQQGEGLGPNAPGEEINLLSQVIETRDRLEHYTLKLYGQLLHWECDSSGKLLAWIRKREQLHSLVLHLRNPRGGEATTQHDIVAVFRDHLKGVYESPGDPDLDDLGGYLTEAFIARILPDSMREGLIAMIPKSEAAASDPAAYRPITMINLDVKVLAKILAVRLANELSHLIHSDQCGFVLG
ncbi:hypothetical protein NDU88_004234 [Pleurodeles waltl]|uniref:Reverse transcriptase domain-containing protein n=1 Tax=Pleurodeles waltl TaxID=8319 RepID=A0AAV7RF73_PLEWA|nr:hypothetical protein NDU88_004234 [Pleurodeles waltl]